MAGEISSRPEDRIISLWRACGACIGFQTAESKPWASVQRHIRRHTHKPALCHTMIFYSVYAKCVWKKRWLLQKAYDSAFSEDLHLPRLVKTFPFICSLAVTISLKKRTFQTIWMISEFVIKNFFLAAARLGSVKHSFDSVLQDLYWRNARMHWSETWISVMKRSGVFF